MGAPVRNVSQLMCLNAWLVVDPWMSQRGMQKVLGSWIFPVMFRREAFAVYHEVFKDVQRLPVRTDGRLGKGARDELFVMMLLGPLLRHNLRWPVSTQVFGHDAEGNGGSAICEATVDSRLAEELWRLARFNGCERVKLGRTSPPPHGKTLRRCLDALA